MDAVEIMMATFPTVDGASEAVGELEGMAKAGTIEIIEAAIVARDHEGNTAVQQVNLPKPGAWAGKGALVGGIIGLVFPPTILAGAIVGAGLGAATGAIAKHALKNDELEAMAAELEPGTSAFLAVVDQTWAKDLAKAMAGYERLAGHTLDADTSANLQVISDEAEGVIATSGSIFTTGEGGEALAAEVESVTDLTTGVTVTGGVIAATDGDEVVVAGLGGVEVPDEMPDAIGGYEAAEEAEEEAEEDDEEA